MGRGKKPHYSEDAGNINERRRLRLLAIEIIQRALKDVQGKGVSKRVVQSALSWLRGQTSGPGLDLETTCRLAGVSIVRVRLEAASRFYGVPEEELTPQQRRFFKVAALPQRAQYPWHRAA